MKALRSAWKISPMQIAQSLNRNLRLSRNPSPHRSLNQNLALSKNQNQNRSRAQNLSRSPSPRLNPARKTEQLSHHRSFPRWKSRPRLQKRYSTCRQRKPLELEHLRQSRNLNLSLHQRLHRNLHSHRPQPRHLLRPLSLHQSQAQMNHP